MKHTLVFHTIDIARKIQKIIDFRAPPISLSYSEASALLVINSTANITQKTLSTILNLEPASIVTLIDELENSQLVKRQIAKNDRRKYQITLTEKGKDKVNQIEKKSLTLNKYLVSKINTNDVNKLYEILERLSNSLNEWKITNNEKNLTRKEVKNENFSPKRHLAL